MRDVRDELWNDANPSTTVETWDRLATRVISPSFGLVSVSFMFQMRKSDTFEALLDFFQEHDIHPHRRTDSVSFHDIQCVANNYRMWLCSIEPQMATAIFNYFQKQHSRSHGLILYTPNTSNFTDDFNEMTFEDAIPIIRKTWALLMKDQETVGATIYEYILHKEITLSKLVLSLTFIPPPDSNLPADFRYFYHSTDLSIQCSVLNIQFMDTNLRQQSAMFMVCFRRFHLFPSHSLLIWYWFQSFVIRSWWTKLWGTDFLSVISSEHISVFQYQSHFESDCVDAVNFDLVRLTPSLWHCQFWIQRFDIDLLHEICRCSNLWLLWNEDSFRLFNIAVIA